MPYDKKLAARVEEILCEVPGVTKKHLFGGLCFLLNGNLCCGVEKDRLMVRVGPDKYDEALKHEYSVPMDFTGKPMKGLVFVHPDGVARKEWLQTWIELGLEFAASQPPK